MDPVSALGAAAAAVQFLTFVSEILGIIVSPDSTTETVAQIESIEEVCRRLDGFKLNVVSRSREVEHAIASGHFLGPGMQNVGLRIPEAQNPYAGLQGLLSKCENACREVVEVVDTVKRTHEPSSKWSNFSLTVKMRINQDKIEKIEMRLNRLQRLAALEMSKISITYQEMHLESLSLLIQESRILGAQHEARLTAIESALKELVDRTQSNTDPAAVVCSDLERMMANVKLSEEMIVKEFDILRSLGFQSRTVRHEAIPDAHRKTFEWVFKNDNSPNSPDQESDQPRLLDWLEHGTGIFWLSGKPGSGKSTFMRFLSGHKATKRALSRWASPLPVVVGSYYFWISGTQMQKSQKGLLQTLIYDIFRNCPDLIKVSCQSRWNEREQPNWTLSELLSTFKTLYKQSHVQCNFCLFIDGLDEFDGDGVEGDHLDLCESLISLAGSSNIKMCVSSRPWNVFEDSFGQDPRKKLYIHTLTRPDIIRYSMDRLYQHPRWSLLESQAAEEHCFVESIADKAQGVFLWVFFVTKILRAGLSNGDRFSDLQRKLERFPVDLEPFLKQMIDSASKSDRDRMGEALRMAVKALEPLNAMVYSCYDDPQSVQLFEVRRERITRRLNGWCKGLLELNPQGNVEFLHRSVAEFLQTKTMSEYLDSCTSLDFDPDWAIFQGYSLWMKLYGEQVRRAWGLKNAHVFSNNFSTLRPNMGITGITNHYEKRLSEPGSLRRLLWSCNNKHAPFFSTIRLLLHYASAIDAEGKIEKELLDNAIQNLDFTVASLSLFNPTDLKAYAHPYTFFRELLLLDDSLLGYISRECQRTPSYFSCLELPAIDFVLRNPDSSDNWPPLVPERLTCLFECGHDPNAVIPDTQGTTIWIRFMRGMTPGITAGVSPLDINMTHALPKFLAALELRLFQLFIEKGNADPSAALPSGGFHVFEEFVLMAFDYLHTQSDQANYLLALDCFIYNNARMGEYRPRPALFDDPFLPHWEQVLKDPGTTPSRYRYLINVLRRVMPLFVQAGWPLEEYPVLSSAVPGFVVPTPKTQLIQQCPTKSQWCSNKDCVKHRARVRRRRKH
ncbi:hypothetical protein QBC38DRAFT_502736 [Podospora fimiseda]|uniref:NACHT domain-containing protein n=1 Tax=Podospora fimiseda TaxID=252190 RepID=A0AAN7BIL1_9PEZI|nr:hypothetical protein QBC38DRAFT_502736 [Podospora fimiseda]